MLSVEALRRILHLVPHPVEGGYFAETYRCPDLIPAAALPAHYGTPRAASTAIYYLLTPDTFSAMHRLASDEIFHFYLGDPVATVAFAAVCATRSARGQYLRHWVIPLPLIHRSQRTHLRRVSVTHRCNSALNARYTRD